MSYFTELILRSNCMAKQAFPRIGVLRSDTTGFPLHAGFSFVLGGWQAGHVRASASAIPIVARPARRTRVVQRYWVLPAATCAPLHTPTLDIFFIVLIFLRSRTGLGKKPREALVHTTHALE